MTSSCLDGQSSIVEDGGEKSKSNNELSTGDQNLENPEGACLKFLQIVTEIILIVFAASLLLIAATVILSKEIPIMMESYDIVPKTLFVLCVIVATCSLVSWIYSKVQNQFQSKPPQASGVTATPENPSLKRTPVKEEYSKSTGVEVVNGFERISNGNYRVPRSVHSKPLVGIIEIPTTNSIEEE